MALSWGYCFCSRSTRWFIAKKRRKMHCFKMWCQNKSLEHNKRL